MSLSVLNRGGISGGLTAIIRVNGLSEADTVTASKDGVIKTSRWISAESLHEISGIRETGAWNVTAINGAQTKTQIVQMDVIGLYEIQMALK